LEKSSIRVMDPACGSGIFLCEVLRSLERRRDTGNVELVGFDVSRAAISMARFALSHSDALMHKTTRLEVRDFLEIKEPIQADIVPMNPPFVAATDLEPRLRQRAQEILGPVFKNRPDLSMVFTTLALSYLVEGGTLATLLPAGVLSQQYGKAWRSSIAEASDVDLLAVLGDHGLFRDAMVNISALMVRKSSPLNRMQAPAMLWASQRKGASSAAMRRLRMWSEGNKRPERTTEWSIYAARPEGIRDRDDWTPRPFTLGNLPDELRIRDNIVTVEKLFHVELGVRAGNIGSAFQISSSDYERLPARERKLFRPVAETKSIKNGVVTPVTFIFYPEAPMAAGKIAKVVPSFYSAHIAPLGLALDAVIDLDRARRDSNLSGRPRIVSRAFFSTGSFAVDGDGSLVVVQGYSWIPKTRVFSAPFDLTDILTDYCFLLNSRVFFMLAREVGRLVGGGQVDGAKNQVKDMPIPDLAEVYLSQPEVKEQADFLRRRDQVQFPEAALLDQFAAAAYGTGLTDWDIPI
jgi:hypothetical protein